MDLTGLTERQVRVLRFALFRFMSQAHANANAAAQDKKGQAFPAGALEAFTKDAKDAQGLLALIAPPVK